MILLESFNLWFSILDQMSTQAFTEEMEVKLGSQFDFRSSFTPRVRALSAFPESQPQASFLPCVENMKVN